MFSIIKYIFAFINILLIAAVPIVFSYWAEDKGQYSTYISMYINLLTYGFPVIAVSPFFYYIIVENEVWDKVYLGSICSFVGIYVFIFYGALVFSFFSPFDFVDESCRYSKQETKFADFSLLRVFYKESIDYFKYQFPKKEEGSAISMEEFCKKYKEQVTYIAQKTKIDYNDNIVNSIAFDVIYMGYLYHRWDIGEIEYNKNMNELNEEFDQHLSPTAQ